MILASSQTTQKRKTGEKTREETEQTHEKNRQQGKTNKWASKRSQLTRLYTKSFGRLQTPKFQKEISLY
jgi:hypothetical protein